MQTLPSLGRRAIIAGGSIAGMLAARALSPHFDEILLIERDEFGTEPAPRPTVPQSAHLHVLLKGGENAIERMLPGFRATIEQSGSVQIDAGLDFVAGSELGLAPRFESKLILHGQSRWMLEYYIRSVAQAQLKNLRIRTGTPVRGLRYDATRNRVTGLDLEGGEALEGDIVIDATGRSEVCLRQLKALGLPLPPLDEVHCDFAYASVTLELAADSARDWKGLVSGNLPDRGARGAVLSPIENGLHICSLGGRAGDYPPGDKESFLEFAKGLPQQGIHEELARGRFVTEISRMRYATNRFRHYERHEAHPSGLLPVGDALCSFNPTYGQGMTSAALQAEAMCEVFATREADASLDTLGRRYLERAAQAAQMPWRNANFNDFLYPTTRGDRAMFSNEEMHYRLTIAKVAPFDPVLRDLSGQVGQLLIPFERLFDDDVRQRVEAIAKHLPS